MNNSPLLSEEDVIKLKGQTEVTLSDGKTYVREMEKKEASCYGCAFLSYFNCYCDNRRIWTEVKH